MSVLLLFQVLDVLRSLCVCNGVAVRSNQNLITENLLPGRELLLQTNIVNYVTRYWCCEVVLQSGLCAKLVVDFLFCLFSVSGPTSSLVHARDPRSIRSGTLR